MAEIAAQGLTVPRIHTASLSGASLGDELLTFARNVLGETPDPWHEWLARHALEVDADGALRFRMFMLLVARQNGKSWFLRVLVLWAMFTGRARFVLWTSQSLSVSGNMHRELCQTINANPHLAKRVARMTQRYEEKTIELRDGTMFRIVANNPDASRSLSVDLLIVDELRTFTGWDGWNALAATTAARPHAMIVCASNAGDDDSIVLNTFLTNARAAVNDPAASTFLAEWSAPEGASTRDLEAIRAANPALGYGRSTLKAIEAARETMPEAGFRTEYLCQRVTQLDPAVPGWEACSDRGLKLADLALTFGFDVSMDGTHVSIVAAATLPDGRVGVRPFAVFDRATAALSTLESLPGKFAWAANGPAASLAGRLRQMPNGVELASGAVTEACMGLADIVAAKRLVHPGDPLLDDQVGGAGRLRSGDRWSFTRRGGGHADSVYACAMAVHALVCAPKPAAVWDGALVI